MKNKLNYIFLSLLVTFSFINNVFAADINFSLVSDNTNILKGEEATIKLNLKSDTALTACLVKVSTDDTLTKVSMNGANGWNITQDGGIEGFLIENNSIDGSVLTNGQNILELKYTVNGDGKVKIDVQNCINGSTEEKFTNISGSNISLTAKDLSEDTTLKSISVNGENVALTTNVFQYMVNLDSANFSLELATTNPDYQNDIVVTSENGETISNLTNITYNAPVGNPFMIIYVTVKNGTPYELWLKYEKTELDNSLSYLKINGIDIELIAGQLDYIVEVGNDIDSIKVEAGLVDSTNFRFDEGDGTYTYNSDTSYIALIIEPVDSSSGAVGKTYTIEIKKAGGAGGETPTLPSSSSKPSSSRPSSGSVTQNPQTGNISMFIMALILFSSLFGSIVLYQKNLESYK